MPAFKDITGQRFGRLVAVRSVEHPKRRRWLWRCDCGNEAVLRTWSVTGGNTLSCGCLYRETRADGPLTHGMYRSPEYRIWDAMWQRCKNPNTKQWKDYGGRGIRVSDHWRSFENFYADVGPRPEGLTLDRIENDGNYEPDNVRWTTRKVQQANRRVSTC